MTPARRVAIVAVARVWIGTPYVHQKSVRGQAADCLGLVRGVWREVVGPEPEVAPPYSADWSESSGEERLWQAAERLFLPVAVDTGLSGDVVLFRMRRGSVAKHLGILAQDPFENITLIHAYSGRGVVETPLSSGWARRIVAQFQFPDRSD